MDRRTLLKSLSALAISASFPLRLSAISNKNLIKPPRLQKGDTIGLKVEGDVNEGAEVFKEQ